MSGLGAVIGMGFGADTFNVCVEIIGKGAAGVTLIVPVEETANVPPTATGSGLVSETRFG